LSGCFEMEFIKSFSLTLQHKPQRISPTAICPFGNSNSCHSETIGSPLCSSDGLSSPSHRSNVPDLYATVIFTSPQFPLMPATVQVP
jgi:hypothetical protein